MSLLIKAQTIDEAYRKALLHLLYRPEFVDTPRNGPMNEVLGAYIEIENPRKRVLLSPGRKISLRYLAGETAFYLAGSESLDFIGHYASFWRKISDDGMTVNSCYGKRLFEYRNGAACISQYDYAVGQLKASKASRKAVMMIYGERDLKLDTKDNACTVYLQFFIRENRLYAEANMRSNDIWLGTPYDIFFFTLLQERVLHALKSVYPDLQMGTYRHHAGSLHLYHKHIEKAEVAAVQEHDMFGYEDFIWDENTEKELAKFLLYESAERKNPYPVDPPHFDSVLWSHLALWLRVESQKEAQ